MTTPSLYAILNSDGLCLNTCLWDGQSDWLPPDGCTIQLIPNDVPVGAGWTFDGTAFVAPAPLAPPEPPTAAERLEAAGFSIAELRALLLKEDNG